MATDSASQSSVGSERINLRVSTGVQGAGGMNFGTLMWIAGNRMHLKVDSDLQPLEKVSLRVDLSPAAGTALLAAVVVRVLPVAPGETGTFLLRLDDVASVDRPGWERFLRLKLTGGTLSDLSDVRSSGATLATGYATSSGAQRNAGLAGVGGAAATLSGAHGLGSGAGRLAMREALRSAIQRTASGSGPAPTPPVPAATAPARPLPLPTPRAAPPGVAPPPETLVWVASNLGGRQYLEVRWLDAGAFTADVHGQLVANVLTLTSDGRTLPTTPPIFMVLRFDGLVLQTNAAPVKQGPASVTYQLGFDDGQRATLRSAARSPSTVSVVPLPRK